MDKAKLFTVLSSVLLLICLVLTITTLVIMGSLIEESKQWTKALDSLLVDAAVSLSPSLPDTPTDTEDETDTEADVLYNRFILKETHGKVGVYDEGGELLRTFNVNVSTLPKEARDALDEGILFHSWKELIELIENYGS